MSAFHLVSVIPLIYFRLILSVDTQRLTQFHQVIVLRGEDMFIESNSGDAA